MVRTLDLATQLAIRAESGVVPRNFVVVTAKSRSTGAPVVHCFWDDIETVTVSVLKIDGTTASHDFTGDGAIQRMDPIPLQVGLSIRAVEIGFAPRHAATEALFRTDDPRQAIVEIYRGWLDPVSQLLLATPRPRFLGNVDGGPIDTPVVGGEGAATLRVVSNRELTRTNPATKSDAYLSAMRDGDRFYKYAGKLSSRPLFWGRKSG